MVLMNRRLGLIFNVAVTRVRPKFSSASTSRVKRAGQWRSHRFRICFPPIQPALSLRHPMFDLHATPESRASGSVRNSGAKLVSDGYQPSTTKWPGEQRRQTPDWHRTDPAPIPRPADQSKAWCSGPRAFVSEQCTATVVCNRPVLVYSSTAHSRPPSKIVVAS